MISLSKLQLEKISYITDNTHKNNYDYEIQYLLYIYKYICIHKPKHKS